MIANLFQLDRDPTAGTTAEWLVISCAAETCDAAEGVRQARARGMRVNHLMLTSLPAPDEVVLAAAAGAKHIVVSEAAPGELADDVRRILPQIGVAPASHAAADVLERLLRTPRCC